MACPQNGAAVVKYLVPTRVQSSWMVTILLPDQRKEKRPTCTPSAPADSYDYFDFGRGFIVATMNVLIIPFWLFIALWLSNYDFTFDTQTNIIAFSLGSALGALAVFIGYAELGHYILARIGKIVKYTNKIVGVVFVILGIYQLTQLF